MPDVNKPQVLRALTHIKEMRKSLAEAEYLRRLRHQQRLHQDYANHVERLDAFKSTLPHQKALILEELASHPVDQRQIHSAHGVIRNLQQRMATLEQERKELAQKHDDACTEKNLAHRKFTTATHQQQKFKEIKMRSDILVTQYANEREQSELEDRHTADSNSLAMKGK
jgi:uncharacterized protein (UPF0335 family)